MNKSRKITGILLACCALLMVAIAGLGVTLAKYTKSADNKTGSARPAIFGVNFAWTGDSTIFAKSYKAPASEAITVSAEQEVVAPGTGGSIVLTISGTSEVSFNLAITISEQYKMGNTVAPNGWTIPTADGAGTEDYRPITYTVEANGLKAGETDIDFENGVANVQVDAGKALAGTITITWTWAFEADSQDAAVKAERDRKDTAVADLAQAGTNVPTYSITTSAIATQID